MRAKTIHEYVKFSEDSDPISDMEIGTLKIGDKLRAKRNFSVTQNWTVVSYSYGFWTCYKDTILTITNFWWEDTGKEITDEGTIFHGYWVKSISLNTYKENNKSFEIRVKTGSDFSEGLVLTYKKFKSLFEII